MTIKLHKPKKGQILLLWEQEVAGSNPATPTFYSL